MISVDNAKGWIGGVIALGDRRVAGSDTERMAHEKLAHDIRALGVSDVELLKFRHNRSLYANMALHFLIAALASVALLCGVPAWACALVHVGVVMSYWLESNKKARVLRHIFPWHNSQNMVATSRARGTMKRRLVVVSHIDAAFTGLIFHPTMIKQALKPPPFEFLMFMRKSMLVATASVLILVGLDLIAFTGVLGSLWFRCLVIAATIPALLTALFNGQVVFKNTVVPGANDNLTGCFALLYLASRLLDSQPDDVELVFVATGCEEAGTGGAWALSEQMRDVWSTEHTTVLGVDTLCGGELHYFEEGELLSMDVPAPLESLVHDELPEVKKYPIPSGATDALPFLVRGYNAMTFGCVDPDIGAPRNYHYPTDDVAHLEEEQLAISLEQIQRFIVAWLAQD